MCWSIWIANIRINRKLIKVLKVACRWGYLSLFWFFFSISLPDGEIFVNGSLRGLNGTDYNVSIFVFDGKNNVGPENITLSISGMRLFNNWSCSWECWLLKMFIYSVRTNVHKLISLHTKMLCDQIYDKALRASLDLITPDRSSHDTQRMILYLLNKRFVLSKT